LQFEGEYVNEEKNRQSKGYNNKNAVFLFENYLNNLNRKRKHDDD